MATALPFPDHRERAHEALLERLPEAPPWATALRSGAFARVREVLLAGDQAAALRLWSELIDLARLLFAEPSPAPIKHWLWRAGLIDSPEVRLPMTTVSEGLAARIGASGSF